MDWKEEKEQAHAHERTRKREKEIERNEDIRVSLRFAIIELDILATQLLAIDGTLKSSERHIAKW
jgi:hypothetical protein